MAGRIFGELWPKLQRARLRKKIAETAKKLSSMMNVGNPHKDLMELQRLLSRKQILRTASTPVTSREGRHTVVSFVRDVLNSMQKSPEVANNKMFVARAIYRQILRKLKRREFPLEEMVRLYAKRNAGQILREGYVARLMEREKMPNAERELAQYLAIMGCVDYANVISACFRAAGIPTLFVRYSRHAFVVFRVNNKWYVADPIFLKRRLLPIEEYWKEIGNFLSPLKGKSRFFVAYSSYSAGIRNFYDFLR